MENCEKTEGKDQDDKVMDVDGSWRSSKLIDVLRSFLGIPTKESRSLLKATEVLKSPNPFLGFSEYMVSGGDSTYQELCAEVTAEFSDCSKRVLEMESLLADPDLCRGDLSALLKAVQEQEKHKLRLTAQIQVLKKAGRPSEQLVSHEGCSRGLQSMKDAEADAAYDEALKGAIRGVQEAVTCINEHLEEVRYEIEALKAEQLEELLERSAAVKIG
ncbi:unnamed protein product [Spirodela intermedia]|uniref:Uncharacterized protein n=1 Tax=Spirodela intermedia TaxID=51605 RepID=A0A7I8I983_SPIIN|nr:unnamed protein product [Spirodela intermedia]CAA6653993.1 unnamed protein product [Spirodela intermedia]